ncbi:MAG TPA: molecular chaperone HtpG [Candidatus Kapabacteria bacterium]|jgi:molecular chaperone HtpG|nr:molecular chaperone HtpG [Candidatus Kapabacteria bacterium]
MDTQQGQNAEQFTYKAEMQQLLHLIIHSLYTHPEVFLRELISNSSDALNKMRFRTLTNSEICSPEAELAIRITTDKDNKRLIIEDTGCGMSREELIENLGTVAKSGTLEFLQSIRDNQQSAQGDLIGQFGVGFYSVFMVTDEVTVETRNADIDGKAWKWSSSGTGTYSIEPSDKEVRGTTISFTLRDDHKEFAEDYRIKSIIKKYSNYVDFPIYLNDEKVNSITALWHKKTADITEEELEEFYKFATNDFDKPLGHIHLSLEGAVEFKALLFIPSVAPVNMFRDLDERSAHLYANKVLIQQHCKDVLPEYLRFVRGVVDTPDLPLNVSREVTQNSPIMAKIRSVITGKVLSLLEDWAENDPQKYATFYKNFGMMLLLGINNDYANRERLIKLLRFSSTVTDGDTRLSLADYVGRMKTDQKEIYYVSGDNRAQVLGNPSIEYFVKNGYEVLLFTDPVEVFTAPYIGEFEGKRLVAADKAELPDTPSQEQTSEQSESTNSLIELFKSNLGDAIEDVRTSQRLVSSAVALVAGKQGLDPHMEKMMKMMDKDFTPTKKVLEINPNHQLISNLTALAQQNPNDTRISDAIKQLYDAALLMDGALTNPTDFINRMTNFMTKATQA